MKKSLLVLYSILALTMHGCASTPKAELGSPGNPEAAVSEVLALMQQAEQVQSDLLSLDEYISGKEYFAKARKGLSAGYENSYILENAAFAKAYFQSALKYAEKRRSNATRILEARKSALAAGIKDSETLPSALAGIDEDLIDETDNFSEALEPKEFSEFQKKYLLLEIKAVQFRELDSVRTAIQKATQDDAEDLAPKSLKTALLDLKEAENLIAQSPRAPETHKPSVNESIGSSVLLLDVMDVISNAEGTPEDIALKIVYQNRELDKLSKNVGNLEKNLKSTETNLQETQGVLKTQKEALKTKDEELASTRSNLAETESALIMQNEELEKNSIKIRFQRAMDEAVKQFPEDEASVYQQESKLIFRLKKINFASGTSTIPAASKPLLSKINNIIKTVGADIVAVQGHTDSVGAAELNSSLSTKRAVSVANYLASLAGGYKIGYIGYGESRPIASNETKEGRAINRRVDLVVTAKK